MTNFYDTLQVSPLAKQAVISAAHEQLISSVTGDNPDAVVQRKLLNDAYFTLGDPIRRERYDRMLLGITSADTPAEKSWLRAKATPILLWLAACGVAIGYLQYTRVAQLRAIEAQEQRIRNVIAAEERQTDPRTEAERKAEMAASQQRREEELRQREERQRQQEADRAEREQLRSFEQARRESDDNMRRRLAAEAQALREHERELREKERQEKMALENEYREAQRRLEQEKSTARRLEAENSRDRRTTSY